MIHASIDPELKSISSDSTSVMMANFEMKDGLKQLLQNLRRKINFRYAVSINKKIYAGDGPLDEVFYSKEFDNHISRGCVSSRQGADGKMS